MLMTFKVFAGQMYCGTLHVFDASRMLFGVRVQQHEPKRLHAFRSVNGVCTFKFNKHDKVASYKHLRLVRVDSDLHWG